jgi:hypothetical protein
MDGRRPLGRPGPSPTSLYPPMRTGRGLLAATLSGLERPWAHVTQTEQDCGAPVHPPAREGEAGPKTRDLERGPVAEVLLATLVVVGLQVVVAVLEGGVPIRRPS